MNNRHNDSTQPHGSYGQEPDPREIERDIDRTRSAMDETLDELGRRLHPRHLVQEAVGALSFGGDGDGPSVGERLSTAASGTFRTMRRYPVPAALVVGGLTWFICEAGSGRTRAKRHNGHSAMEDAWDAPLAPSQPSGIGAPYGEFESEGEGSAIGRRVSDVADSAKQRMRDAGDFTKRSVRDAAGTISQTAHTARDVVSSTARRALGSASETAHELRERMHEARLKAQRRMDGLAQRARHTGEEALQDHPLVVGAGALAAGLLIGVMLPATRLEDETLGERSQELKKKAAGAGRQLIERGRKVATESASAAMEEARRQGIAPGQLAHEASEAARSAMGLNKERVESFAEKASHVAREAASTAKEEAGRQMGDTGGTSQKPSSPGASQRANPNRHNGGGA